MQATSTSDIAMTPAIVDNLAERDEREIEDDMPGDQFPIEVTEHNGDTDEPVLDYGPMLDAKELHQIQHDIVITKRPTWQSSPPADFGSPAHGKLKADQWRTCIEFDLPVSLVKLWQNDSQPDNSVRYCRNKAIHSTMMLAMAVRWGTSHRTSKRHAQKYLDYMKAYLQTLLELCPNQQLHPIHHNALHLPEFLLRFGPVHGWWMFPFERMIGILQKINTNSKMGKIVVITLYANNDHHNQENWNLR